MMIEDSKGQLGNEIIAAVILGGFVFAVIVYVVVSAFAGQLAGIIAAIIIFVLMFAFVAGKVGKYER